ncbi:2-hydroxychromene-2-carboxylate isomerase [Burkholderia cepacia]|uniref:2-hydroxychromene-2-carboxylate isomerase n=1 Tax=Burkholderia cepacia TaxID=292 RepID=UPI00158B870B|nr:2-hydroxychromene-2-carboxylate isomerase [Burkholderia cepacia]
MSVLRVQFHFDFGSPNSYLSHRIIPSIEDRQGIKFEYVPVLLGGLFRLTGNKSPAEAFAGIKNKPEFADLEMKRFIEKHELSSFRKNPHWPVNTLQIMRGAVVAQRNNLFMHYVNVVFSSMWEQGLKMDDPAIIAEVLDAAGMNGHDFQQQISDPVVKNILIENTEESFARGAFGSPTFFVGDEIFFGKDQLRDVENEIENTKIRMS